MEPDLPNSEELNIEKIENSENNIEKNIEKNEKISNKKSNFNGLIIALIVVVAIAAFFAGSYSANLNSEDITKTEFDAAIAKLEAKINTNQQSLNQQNPQPVRISADDDPVRGNLDAPITIIEFSDFECPFCARFHVQTLPLLLDEYINTGKAKLVYRDLPLSSIHQNALPAALAAECANEQEKYWDFHDLLFENQSVWSKQDPASNIATFSQYATQIEMNEEQFVSCLTTGKYIEEIQNDLNDGRDYGVSGTPGFFVGNDQIGFVKLDGAQPFESFKKIIDAQLNA